ncbi:cysteine proteinase, partial [Aureobasidium melanogenum]
HDSDTKDDAQPSEGSRAESTYHTSTTSPEVHSRNKRLRTQPATNPRQSASPKYPEEQPRSKRESTHSSPNQGRVTPAKEYLYRIQSSFDITSLTKSSRLEGSSRTRQTYAHPSTDRERGQQRANQRRAVASADEKRLFPDSYPSTEGSTIISMPREDWITTNTTNTMKRKPPGSSVRPANTLNRPGPGFNTLTTVKVSGANVSENTAKRQKTNHEFADDDTNDMLGDSFGNRGLQGQQHSAPRRPPSIVSLTSQSQETLSQKINPFTHDEARNIHSTLNHNKKKGRKPKIGAALPSSPRQGGTFTDPVSVDDNDDIQILSDQRSPPRSINRTAPPRISRDEAHDQFARRITAQETRNHAKPATHVLDHIEIDQPRSPLLAETFVRDDEEPDQAPVLHQAQPKFKNRMQSTSNTARPLQNKQTIEDSSEDELSREPAVQSSVRKSKQVRSPSPNHIVSTHFTKKRSKAKARDNITIALSSLRMKAGNWKNLYLIYSWQHKAMQFIKNDEVLLNRQGVPIQLGSKHVQTLFCSTSSSTAAIFGGCNDNFSSGKIYFEFASTNEFDEFLEAADHMNDRANVKDLQADKFTHVCEGAETFFKPAAATVDPELQAMSHRQDQSRAYTNRERTLAAQRGVSLPEPTNQITPTRMTRAMKSEFTNQPANKSARDLSLPPPVARTEQSTPVRSSRRLQIRDSGKAAIPAEPEVERWTVKHGIPKWDAPLTYPAVGTNRTTVDAEDIARLDDGELLNDNIISFCLREMQENNPDLKGKAHIFNSFFYETLSTLPSRKRGFNYEGVKRWTRNIDLFSHPYVAVPINTQYHWFLVIICNLDKLERKLKLEDLGDDEEEPENEPQPTVEEPAQSQSTVSNDIEIPETPPQETKDDVLSQGVKRISLDASQEQEEELPPLSKLKPISRKGKKQAPPLPKVDPDTPALIILDSLSGTHTQEVKNLKQYVVHEGRDKRGLEFEYTELKGMNARGLPQQTNFCDCGVYLIGYMEAFLRDPAEFVRKVMSRELDHNNDFADFDPSKKRTEIRDRLIKLEEEQSFAKKQKKKEKARLLKMANQDNSTTSPAPVPKQISSPARPPEAQTDSRMVQSSPMKPPPPPIHKPSPRKPSPHESSSYKTASPRRSPPTVERSLHDEMLFGDTGDTAEDTGERTRPGNYDNYSYHRNGDRHDQPTIIHSRMDIRDELEQAAQHASQVNYEEE